MIKIGNKIFFIFLFFCLPSVVLAYGSANYKINLDNFGFGGSPGTSSANYRLSDTIGEPVVGIGSSANYKTKAGFWFMVDYMISLELDSNSKDLGVVTPGTPNTASTIATVTTDAVGGYDLLISENHSLTHNIDGTTTITDFPGTIASPIAWSGTGLGFTVTGGTGVEAKWGSAPNNNYAGIPTTDTLFHEKNGYTGGSGDDTTVQYKIDVPTTQKSGIYSNTIIYTAITKL